MYKKKCNYKKNNYNSIFIPKTLSVAFAAIIPATFLAVQLYMPMSTNFTSTIKNTSSLAMTFIRRSCAAGKSVPPSFCQDI